MLTVVETSFFARRAEKLLSSKEREELLFYLAVNPEAGDEIPGTGGVRKVRFAAKGKGKSGGLRVIYYLYDEENPLYAILLYGKNEQVNLTAHKCETSQPSPLQSKQQLRPTRASPESEQPMKQKNIAQELVESMREASAIAKGEAAPAAAHYFPLPLDVDVRAVRAATGLSRAEFARRFALDPRALQDWEQGRRYPDRAARAYLTVIARNAQAVVEALAS
jgi:DNA-binding transcriptional regulator YiaG